MQNTSAIQPVLEPLCRATEQTLKPVELADRDFLFISLDDEGRFICEIRAFRPHKPEDDHDDFIKKVLINGQWMSTCSSGASWKAHNAWQKRIPERRQRTYGTWVFAPTDFTVLVIYHVWPREKLVFTKEAELQYELILNRFLYQSMAAKIAADFKVSKIVPPMPSDFKDHPELPLSDYQKVALMCCLEQESFGLFMEQGTGKTAIAVSRINVEARRKRADGRDMYRALIVCPQQVRANWDRELERFSIYPGKVSIIKGTKLCRSKALIEGFRDEDDCDWSACIISTDSVSRTWEALRLMPWDLVILDESHYIKSNKSNRSKFMHKFNEIRCEQRMILTGTPICNTIFDLWSQFEFLGRGASGFKTFENYRGFHGKFHNEERAGRSPIQKLIGIRALPLVQERLTRMAFMITKEDAALNLPDKVYDLAEVDMTPAQQKIYDQISAELVVQIDEILEKETDMDDSMTVEHVLTKLLRLAQICSGHVRWDPVCDPGTNEIVTPARVEQIPGGNPKIDYLVKELKEKGENDPNGKTIIWCSFIEDMRALSTRLHDEGINHVGYHRVTHPEHRVRDARVAEQRMNLDPECKVFIGNPASAAEGLNIIGYDRENPEASDTRTNWVVYFSSNWSMVQRSQSEDRAHRRGTRDNVRITDLMIPETIDEEIRARVLAKKQTAMKIQDVREILVRLTRKDI